MSQSHNDYAPISEILRGDITDVRMVYGAACWSVISLFRPVLWGYLVFGFESGLAFAWSMKLCIMILVSFDCAFLMIKSKPLSLLFSILLCFSPLIQWWGTGEVVLYGQALVLLLDKALFTRKRSIRVIAIVAIAWLCGCYIMLMYPAWMVPFFYIFALMGVFRAIDYCRILKSGECRSVLAWSISDTLTSIFCLLVSAGLVFLAFSSPLKQWHLLLIRFIRARALKPEEAGFPNFFRMRFLFFMLLIRRWFQMNVKLPPFSAFSLLGLLRLCPVSSKSEIGI